MCMDLAELGLTRICFFPLKPTFCSRTALVLEQVQLIVECVKHNTPIFSSSSELHVLGVVYSPILLPLRGEHSQKQVIYCLFLPVPNGSVPAKSNFELQLDLIGFSETSFVIKLGNSVANQTPYILSLKNSDLSCYTKQ